MHVRCVGSTQGGARISEPVISKAAREPGEEVAGVVGPSVSIQQEPIRRPLSVEGSRRILHAIVETEPHARFAGDAVIRTAWMAALMPLPPALIRRS